jgi:Ribbon-helix-helix protein, copG family.
MVNDKINFNLRISEELNEELIKIAKEEGRSKNGQIEYILKEFVKQYNIKTENYHAKIEQHDNETAIGEININKGGN